MLTRSFFFFCHLEEFKTISVVEKGRLDSSFTLEDGGIVNLTLRFLLSEEERLRVHELVR